MAYNLKKGLVGYWPLDEVSGTRRDHSGLGNNLTDNNTVTDNPGPSIWIPRAGQFTRANTEWLSIADNPSLSFGSGSYTVCFWCFPDDLNQHFLVGKDTVVGSDREWDTGIEGATDRFFTERGNANWGVVDTLYASTLGVISASAWYFYRAWHDSLAATLNIQINNGAIDSMATTATMADTAAVFNIGRREANVDLTNGRIAAVGLWNRVITAQETSWLYNRGDGRSLAHLRPAA